MSVQEGCSSVPATLDALARQVMGGTPLSRGKAEWLTTIQQPHLHELFRAASRIRDHFVGTAVCAAAASWPPRSVAAARIARSAASRCTMRRR